MGAALKRGEGRLRRVAVWGVVCGMLCALYLTGCKRAVRADAGLDAAQQAAIAPGAQGWQEAALLLPAGASAVVTMSPAGAVSGLDALYQWVVAEPQMWGEGEDGAMRVSAVMNLRHELSTGFGYNFLSVKAWEELGIRADRPVHVAVYPLSASAEAMVSQAERSALSRLNVPLSRLHEGLEERPSAEQLRGWYAELDALKRELTTAPAIRLVFSVRTSDKLLELIDRTFSRWGYEALSTPVELRAKRLYWDDSPQGVNALLVRERDGAMVIDLLALSPLRQVEGSQARREAVLQQVVGAVGEAREGRAMAPAPSAGAVCALSMSQEGVGRLMRYTMVREAVAVASRAGAGGRDEALLSALLELTPTLHAWELGSEGLSGFVYELEAGGRFEEEARMMSLRMSLVGRAGGEALNVSRGGAHLNVQAQGVGVTLDPAMLASEAWGRWLTPAGPERLLMTGDEVNTELSLFAATWGAGLPRQVAQVLSSLAAIVSGEAPLEVVTLYAQRAKVARVEAIVPGLDVSDVWRKPRWVALVSLDPKLSALDRDAMSAALRDALHDGLSAWEGGVSEVVEGMSTGEHRRAQALKAGEVMAFDTGVGSPLGRMRYFYQKDGDNPYILIGYGENAAQHVEEALAQVRRSPANARGTGSALRVRVQPAALLQLASTYQAATLGVVDLPILMQRLGPLLLDVSPGEQHGSPAIHYRLELMAPPDLLQTP